MNQPTLYDTLTKANKDQMALSLTLAQAMEELEKSREAGDTLGVSILQDLVNTILAEITPIEE
jgi:hypothetical protein